MNPEVVDILKYVLSGAGGVTLWKLLENYQKHVHNKDIKKSETDEEKDAIINELKDRIRELEIDNAKKETWLLAFKEELEKGTLTQRIKELSGD